MFTFLLFLFSFDAFGYAPCARFVETPDGALYFTDAYVEVEKAPHSPAVEMEGLGTMAIFRIHAPCMPVIVRGITVVLSPLPGEDSSWIDAAIEHGVSLHGLAGSLEESFIRESAYGHRAAVWRFGDGDAYITDGWHADFEVLMNYLLVGEGYSFELVPMPIPEGTRYGVVLAPHIAYEPAVPTDDFPDEVTVGWTFGGMLIGTE